MHISDLEYLDSLDKPQMALGGINPANVLILHFNKGAFSLSLGDVTLFKTTLNTALSGVKLSFADDVPSNFVVSLASKSAGGSTETTLNLASLLAGDGLMTSLSFSTSSKVA